MITIFTVFVGIQQVVPQFNFNFSTTMPSSATQKAVKKKPHPLLKKPQLFSDVLPLGTNEGQIKAIFATMSAWCRPTIALRKFSAPKDGQDQYFARLEFVSILAGK